MEPKDAIKAALESVALAVNETEYAIGDYPTVAAHIDPTDNAVVIVATDGIAEEAEPGDEIETALIILQVTRVRIVRERVIAGMGGGAEWSGRQVTTPAGNETEVIDMKEWHHES